MYAVRIYRAAGISTPVDLKYQCRYIDAQTRTRHSLSCIYYAPWALPGIFLLLRHDFIFPLSLNILNPKKTYLFTALLREVSLSLNSLMFCTARCFLSSWLRSVYTYMEPACVKRQAEMDGRRCIACRASTDTHDTGEIMHTQWPHS